MARQSTIEPYSSQMHSSHHWKGLEWGVEIEDELTFQKIAGASLKTQKQQFGGNLPPSGITETLGIHFAHVTHTDNANRGILHGAAHSDEVRCDNSVW